MRRAPFFWGLLFIVAGVVFWLDTLHVLPAGVRAWDLLWPLALILAGLWLLIGRLVAPGASALDVAGVRVPLEGAQRLHLALHQGVGQLRVDGQAPADMALEGSCVGGVEGETRAGRELEVRLRQPHLTFTPFEAGSPLTWDLHLTPQVPVELEVRLGMGETELDLSAVQLQRLELHGGMGATRLSLPAPHGEVAVLIESGVGELRVALPEAVACALRAERGLGQLTVTHPAFRAGPEMRHETPDFVQATDRYVMTVKMGVGQVVIEAA